MSNIKSHIKTEAGIYLEGWLNSYSQIFFSDNKPFAIVLMLSTFIAPVVGLSGVAAIAVTQIIAAIFGFDKTNIRNGLYTYNSLMSGMVMGVYYEMNYSFWIILVFVSIITFFSTIWIANITVRYKVPFLSLPFLFGVWIILLGAYKFTSIELNYSGLYLLTDSTTEGKYLLQFLQESIASSIIPDFIEIYLKSLGAIMFQYSILAGLLIAVALFIHSRISFLLSLVGYAVGYLFYYYMEGDFTQLIYSYIGFNYILTAIALGGFFIVPSKKSFFLVILTIPLIALLISALDSIFGIVGLPLYSLPFNIIVILFLAGLQLRLKSKNLDIVQVQQFSPEKNHYKHKNRLERFKTETYFHIALPFLGEWTISQGHEGKITHKDEWKEAWDFEVLDDNNKSYRGDGNLVEDYYCHNLPVLAPAAGYIIKIVDGYDDNIVGEADLENNWGNTIIIKHADYLYTKLSHLRKETFKVNEGDYVSKGEILAYCGNSGRSPVPHLHFQLQASPYIGSKTLNYPLTYYITQNKGKNKFHSFEIPKEKDLVTNVNTTKILSDAFKFVSGKTLEFEVDWDGKRSEKLKWEIFVDIYKATYIYCHKTKSYAYFVNNKTLFYFTDFEGKKSSFLYYFYIGMQKVLLGYYSDIELKDKLLSNGFFNPILHGLHDLTAPFFHYLKVDYLFNFGYIDNEHKPKEINLETSASTKIFGRKVKQIQYQICIANDCINNIEIFDGKRKITAKCVKTD